MALPFEGLDRLADIQQLREAAQRPAQVQQMQMPSPDVGLQSLGQQEVDVATGVPVGFNPSDAMGQVMNTAGQYAMANPQKTGPFAAALAAFGAGSEAANMIDKRVSEESEREDLSAVRDMAQGLPDRTRTVMPTTTMRQDIPFEIQEEVQVSEMSPQEGLSGILTMQDGGKVDSNSNEEYFEEVVRPLEFGDAYFKNPKYYNKDTNSYVAYKDSEGKLTFGAGVLVDKDLMKSMGKKSFKVGDEISQSTIDNEALKRWNSSVRQAKELYPNLTNKQVNPIAEMVYQMGKAGVNKFTNMRKAIEAGDADAAKKAALDSTWAKQTPKRAKEVAERLRASFALFRRGGGIGQYFEGQVEGEGDGMSDEITFRVEGGNPDYALLSKDEYVLPADVVSMLGNGSSDAGSDELDQFVKDTRKQAFGREEQQTQIDAEEGLSSLV